MLYTPQTPPAVTEDDWISILRDGKFRRTTVEELGIYLATILPSGGGGGVTDHGALTGLADDDHPQYHNDARGDARYSLLAHNHTGVYDPAGSAAAAQAAAIAASAPVAHVGSSGTAHANATTSVAGFMSGGDKTKLDGVATGATANSTDATLLARANHTGTQLASTISDFSTAVAATAAVTANTAKVTNATHTGDVTGATALTITNNVVTNAKLADVATSTIKGRVTAATGDPEDLTATQVRTLLNVADGATVNSPDATLLARANHTGTQLASTVSDFSEAVDDRVAALLVAGTNMTINYDDVANTITLISAGGDGGSGLTQAQVSTIASLRI